MNHEKLQFAFDLERHCILICDENEVLVELFEATYLPGLYFGLSSVDIPRPRCRGFSVFADDRLPPVLVSLANARTIREGLLALHESALVTEREDSDSWGRPDGRLKTQLMTE